MPEQEQKGSAEPEERVLISGRVRKSVRRRMRLYAAANDENLQDLLDKALDEYLSRRKS
ncbi:hypothetical protein [Streptomyces antimycoticus]|uniref:hypothetical protein n=1 Tax=Streptomyces antimycoticus TaxID=68175 RepID=UPI00191BABB0|nr:hypothetical protein [Streptomyces antimycoticus]